MKKKLNLFEHLQDYLNQNPKAKEIFELFKVSEKEYVEALKYSNIYPPNFLLQSLNSTHGDFDVSVSTSYR